MYALRVKNYYAAKILIKNKADPSAFEKDLILNPLLSSVFDQDIEAIKLLVEHGVDFTKANKDHITPVQYAVCLNFIPAVRYLLSKLRTKCESSEFVRFKNSLLLYALSFNKYEMVEHLINSERADKNCLDNFGEPAIGIVLRNMAGRKISSCYKNF